MGRQEVETLAGDRLRDEDPHAVAPATGVAAMP
jgi:hypothetical protein